MSGSQCQAHNKGQGTRAGPLIQESRILFIHSFNSILLKLLLCAGAHSRYWIYCYCSGPDER